METGLWGAHPSRGTYCASLETKFILSCDNARKEATQGYPLTFTGAVQDMHAGAHTHTTWCLVQGVALLGGVALLEDVCHCGCGQWDPPPNHVGASLLAAFRWRGRTLSSSCTMPAWTLPCFHLDDNGLNLWTCKLAPIKCCLIRVALAMASVHSNGNLRQISSSIVFNLTALSQGFLLN